MPVKRYGIYLAYEPTVDLRAQGLGRHLAALLEAASKRDDVRFVVACPSWTQESLVQLCESEGIAKDAFDMIAPPQQPALLRLYRLWRSWRAPRRRRKGHWWSRYLATVARVMRRIMAPWVRALVGSRSITLLIVVGGFASLAAAVTAPLGLAGRAARRAASRVAGRAMRATLMLYFTMLGKSVARDALAIVGGTAPKNVPSVVDLYRQMQEAEVRALHELIERLTDVRAWYCPTAYWPSVTTLSRPQLICVPDVVLCDFAAGFGPVGGGRLLQTFEEIGRTIGAGQHFLAYSEQVKWRTLVRRFHVAPSSVHVIPHGANRLDPLIFVRGSAEPERATDAFCAEVVAAAVARHNSIATTGVLGRDTRFLFYASQFRPHKNVPNLLRAFEHLLRRRYVSCKLVLTGDPDASPETRDAVASLRLSDEVVFLPRLSPRQLAACYRRAALAVNPSMFEAGLPFTFSEAVSVGTPVVMARIPVTTDAIVDPALADDMLFDPLDWEDMAARIEWALAQRDSLLARQRAFFERHVGDRTWDNALDDYLAALEDVCASHELATRRTDAACAVAP